jgi:hypothetical protein
VAVSASEKKLQITGIQDFLNTLSSEQMYICYSTFPLLNSCDVAQSSTFVLVQSGRWLSQYDIEKRLAAILKELNSEILLECDFLNIVQSSDRVPFI